MSKARTWNEWKDRGYHVVKGQRATGRNAEGVATFTRDQVAKTPPRGYAYPDKTYGLDWDNDSIYEQRDDDLYW